MGMGKKWWTDRNERNKRDRMHTGKIKHEHMMSALHHAMSLRRKSPDANISMYDCEYCDFIHVGNGGQVLEEYHET